MYILCSERNRISVDFALCHELNALDQHFCALFKFQLLGEEKLKKIRCAVKI